MSANKSCSVFIVKHQKILFEFTLQNLLVIHTNTYLFMICINVLTKKIALHANPHKMQYN